MKKVSAVLICLVFMAGTAVASPFGEGGGSSPGEEESNLAAILMITVVVGFTALLVGDIMADDGLESQDALAGIPSDSVEVSEQTGVDWARLTPADSLPVLAIAVFQGNGGRESARYMASLLSSRENIDYTIHGSPAALGNLSPGEAASTGFSFVPSDFFLTGGPEGLFLFRRGNGEPHWSFPASEAGMDSVYIRSAASSLIEHLTLP